MSSFSKIENHIKGSVGVDDFVLLENFTNKDAFVENLKSRFQNNIIYTYIGQVLISVNPYKLLPLYTDEVIKTYFNKHIFELPPHIFAIADNAFRILTNQNKDQCILISGESGSGKTEASKTVLRYIAACSGHQTKVKDVKDNLLNSNAILEAFGNAKTNRNNNSSRFGKYMDVEFDFRGIPIGGNIHTYLLEKTRVISQHDGERNFHIFYQFIFGADTDILKNLGLTSLASEFQYLSCGTDSDEKKEYITNFKQLRQAMNNFKFSEKETIDMFSIIAAILYLGNINFENNEDNVKILNPELLDRVAKLLGVSTQQLNAALLMRTIDAHGDVVISPLDNEVAAYAKDALAKSIYDRLFNWVVQRINNSLRINDKDNTKINKMGILDIYGFEVFEQNNFEQFCINFCNEKLQQLFIQLTLKSEQEEYRNEGIEWIKIDFFDNRVICDLIEEKHRGIIYTLDEECLMPGDRNDLTFLKKLSNQLKNHSHFVCQENTTQKLKKSIGPYKFCLVHYAGDVTYNVKEFIKKNNDLLFRDLKETIKDSSNSIIGNSISENEFKMKKRPVTVITQFKTSLNCLIDILIRKEPSYIRCIKPNDFQKPDLFDEQIVHHQVKYLGLMENLRIRRAGFAYRRDYTWFLNRYKCLSQSTWPNFKNSAKEGVHILLSELKYNSNDYQLGKSKIFIRSSKTLFEIEDKFQEKKHFIAAILQSHWKGYIQRKKFLKLKAFITKLQSYCRGYIARKKLQQRRLAVKHIQNFIKGFITRNEPPNGLNDKFIIYSKHVWLLHLSKTLPKSILDIDNNWPNAPSHCVTASMHLKEIYRKNLAQKYRLSLLPNKKKQLELKVLAEQIFKDKKKSYPRSIPDWFQNKRAFPDDDLIINKFMSKFNEEIVIYSSYCTKYDRHGYKSRDRFLILSNSAVYVLDAKSHKQKHRLSLDKISFVLTNQNDELLIIRIPLDFKDDKGDLILIMPNVIEFIVSLADLVKSTSAITIIDRNSVEHNVVKGRQGTIDIVTGNDQSIQRNKNGHLVIAS